MNMKDIYSKMKEKPRLLVEAELEPVQGNRIQPTGFPEVGAATYERPDNTRMLLVESAQSMANWLESTILKDKGPELDDKFNGLSYILIDLKYNGKTTKTSSLVEPHRLNSPYIMTGKKSQFANEFKDKADYLDGSYPDWHKMASAVFYYDINSLLHGIFLSNLEGGGRFRIPRALSSFIEAENIREVTSGGSKISNIDPAGSFKVNGGIGDSYAYSNIPYTRMEYTANKITAYFNIDVSLILSYKLGDAATDLLLGLSLYKIKYLLKNNLKLRTACDLKLKDENSIKVSDNIEIPDLDELLINIQENIKQCTEAQLFRNPPVTILNGELVRNTKEKKGDPEANHNDNEEIGE